MTHTLRTIISRTSTKVIGQGHQGQKCRNFSFQPEVFLQKRWSKVKATRVKVKVTEVKVVGQGQTSQGSRSKVVGQGHRAKVKFVGGEALYPIDSRVFSSILVLLKSPDWPLDPMKVEGQ